jgi:hypothetical protein
MALIRQIWYQQYIPDQEDYGIMAKTDVKLHDLVDISSPQQTLKEIKYVLTLIDSDFAHHRFTEAYLDIISLFNGKYPGYRASNTKYHNLEHTCSVALALTRLTHGLIVDGISFSPRVIELGLIAALFHDTGLIQTEDDLQGTGAQYTAGHEARSINSMENYLAAKKQPAEDIDDCSHIIQCTILDLPLPGIPFRSAEIKTMGQVMGTADLIAQVAERNYLEKLPLLFLEFKEAKMPGFETPLELFNKTEEFYHSVVQKRLAEELGNVGNAARSHFRERWGIDRNLYAEAMRNNIEYTKKLKIDGPKSYDSLKEKLRRKV